MKFPSTPQEQKELEKKLKENDAAGDWVSSVFPSAGIENVGGPAEVLLRDVGDTPLNK